MSRVPWDVIELESNPEDAWISFKDLFMSVADSNAPDLTCAREVFTMDYSHYKRFDENARFSSQKSYSY